VLQYADDTLIVLKAVLAQLTALKALLQQFSGMTGLNINYDKNTFVPIGLDNTTSSSLASSFGCAVARDGNGSGKCGYGVCPPASVPAGKNLCPCPCPTGTRGYRATRNPQEQASQSPAERWVAASGGGAPAGSQGCGEVDGGASAGLGRDSARPRTGQPRPREAAAHGCAAAWAPARPNNGAREAADGTCQLRPRG
jgi:hypothetical protein